MSQAVAGSESYSPPRMKEGQQLIFFITKNRNYSVKN